MSVFKSIRSTFIVIAVILSFLLTLLGTTYYFHLTSVLDELELERQQIHAKANLVNDMEDSYNDMVFRSRGYYAYKDERELNRFYSSKREFKSHLDEFDEYAESEQERILYENLVAFVTEFEENTVPTAIFYVENNDYESLRMLANSGVTDTINEFLTFTRATEVESAERMDEIYDQSINTANQYTLMTMGLSAVIIILLMVLGGYLLSKVLRPIEHLKQEVNALANGEDVSVSHNMEKRQDEIGELNQSFYEMAQVIQGKEEELTAQNEELQAQQDEINDSQEQVNYYIADIENMTKAMNQFSLVTSIDKNGVFTYVNEKFTISTQYKEEDAVGKSFKLLQVSKEDHVFFQKIKQKVQSGSIWNGEVRFSKKDGTNIWLQMTVVPYVNEYGQPYQYIAIGLDITGSKQTQHKLKDSLNQTEKTKDKLERYNQLNHAMSLNLGKENFVSTVFSYINKLYEFDKSVMMILDEPIYQAMGLTETSIADFIDRDHTELLARLKSQNHITVTRNATVAEQGLVPEKIDAFDYYTTIRNANGEAMAIFAATKVGRPVSEKDLVEIDGIMNRVSIALERVLIYEEMEDSRKVNQDIINNINEGIHFVSNDGEMIQVNEKMFEMVSYKEGRNKKQVTKDKWIKAFTKKIVDPEITADFFNKSIEKHYFGGMNHQYILDDKNGEKVVEVYASSVFNDDQERVGTIFVHRDITNEHELDQMKSELVSTVSHELRTPLSSVLGFTELLLKKDLKPERQRKYLDTIYREAKRLTNLINDFLDLQRMESGKQKYEMTTCSLDSIVMDVMNNFKHVNTHQLSFVDESVYVKVKADFERLEQVLTNLISNAVKFSPDGGNITVKMQNENNQMVVSIEDHGLGIPHEAVDKLFSKFHRIDQTDRKKIGGTGLGLAIAKEIIDQHGGSIWVESEEGTGSTFYFSLPLLEEVSMEGSTKIGINPSNNLPGTVMIIEDDTSLALLLSEELKANGFRVIHHYDPQNAYEDIVRLDLTAVVVDLMLGDDMDGWELIQTLKSNQKTKNLPIIISSALDRSDEKVELYQVNEYLTKPYPPDKLSTALLQFVKSHHNQSGEVLFPSDDGEE
ncbi:ATP-binding protein [Salipaludibacillus sp. HK11]|uniref:ATP-binding protein n=1 Tax=Salipaludibacillus sp. HK11 TaxID=3394320 RepID=UPI0039FC70B7